MDPILKIQDISKNFGGVRALAEVSFDFIPGQILGLIGPNGAGKTTLFNLISGTLPPTAGQILFDSQDITGLPPEKRSRLGLMRTFQNLSLFPELSILENVALGANSWNRPGFKNLLGLKTRDKEKRILEEAVHNLELVGLKDQADFFPGQLSYGNQRRLEIARALTGKPSLLLFDEPAAGLNNFESQELGELMLNLREKLNLSILIIEHDMDVLMTVSDWVVVLVEGAVLTQAAPKEVQKDPQVIAAYLGEEDAFADLKPPPLET